MFFIILILICAISFLVGFLLGKNATPKISIRRTSPIENPEEYENFLKYNGDIQ